MAAIHHAVPGPGFPATNPRHVPEASESVRFDEALHLALEGPRYIKTLDGGEAQFPVPMGQGGTFQGLAYSAPFRLLSEEGVKALRGVLRRWQSRRRSRSGDPQPNRQPLGKHRIPQLAA